MTLASKSWLRTARLAALRVVLSLLAALWLLPTADATSALPITSDLPRLVSEFMGSNLPFVEYVRGSDWGGGVGGILYTSRAGTLSWAHYNGRGDVVSRSDDTGNLTYAASYEAFGTRTGEGGANDDRQRANTKEEDRTGLLNEGMRYRDLETGIFLTRDPAGFVDGPNAYTYVRQNPWSSFDPLGLNEVVVSGGVCIAPKKDVPEHHDSDWKHFIKAAELQISARKSMVKQGEQVEWLVERSTYEARGQKNYINEIEGIAKKNGVVLRWFDSKAALADVINHSVDGKERSGAGLISHFDYYGHGRPGELWTKYEDKTGYFSADDLAAGLLHKGAFASGCTATHFGCNGATPQYDSKESLTPNGKPSFSSAWQSATGVPMRAMVGSSDYGPTAERSSFERLMGNLAPMYPRRIPSAPILGQQHWGPNRGKPSYWVPKE